MDGRSVTRREILGALTVAGSTGAVVGTGTAGLFADDESMPGNGFTSGTVDLEVEWAVLGGGPTGSSEGRSAVNIDFSSRGRSGAATFTVRLPPDGENNPAYAWLRVGCPVPSPLNEALTVELRYDDWDGNRLVGSFSSLLDMADALRNGTPLDPRGAPQAPGNQQCLSPGSPLTLYFSWDLPDDFSEEGDTTVTFEFVGRQCRYNDGRTNPFAGTSSDPCADSGGKDISWVGFCAEEPLSEGDVQYVINGDTLVLTTGPDSINTILLKAGTTLYVFTGGTISSDSSNQYFTTEPSRPSSWSLAGVYSQDGNGYDGTNRTNSDPCPGDCATYKDEVGGDLTVSDDCGGGS